MEFMIIYFGVLLLGPVLIAAPFFVIEAWNKKYGRFNRRA